MILFIFGLLSIIVITTVIIRKYYILYSQGGGGNTFCIFKAVCLCYLIRSQEATHVRFSLYVVDLDERDEMVSVIISTNSVLFNNLNKKMTK